jgi:hypothetical protein
MEINWLQIGIGALSGGLAGAFLKQFFDNRRNRLQPISYSVELKPFYDLDAHSIIPSKIILKENNQEYSFTNLIIGSLSIKNTGLVDYSKFSFGLTLDDDANFINIKQEDQHRHHTASYSVTPAISNEAGIVDITLEPFNRKNIYKFDFLISAKGYYPSINDMTLDITSTQAVKLIKISDTKAIDLAFEIVKPIIQLGPIRISLGR